MGYYTTYTEQIHITPTVPWDKIKDTAFVMKDDDHWGWTGKDVQFAITTEHKGGDLTGKYAYGIKPTLDDSYKGYYIVEHVQEIVDLLGPEYTYDGYINAEGEDTGDLWRLYVIDGRATAVKAIITWPEV